jgi:methyl-accepting chemotaxis protein
VSNSNGSSDRLDRIEALVEANSRAIAENNRAIAENSQAIAQNSQAIAENRSTIAENSRAIAEQRESIAQLAQAAQAALSMAQGSRESLQQTEQLTRRNAAAIARLEEKMEQYIVEGREHREFIATQVDGIRLETRRIIQHLFGEMDNE